MKRHYHRCLVEVADALQFAGRSVSTHPCGALVFANEAEEHAREFHGLDVAVGNVVEDEGSPYGMGGGIGSARCFCGESKELAALACPTCCELECRPDNGRRRRGRPRKWLAREDGLLATKAGRAELGVCTTCGKRAPAEDCVQCAVCLERIRAAKARREPVAVEENRRVS